MKVLHIGKYFPPYAGGMETYLRDLMMAQARQGIATSALVHQSDISLTSQKEVYQAGDQLLPVSRAAVWARLLFTPISPTLPFLLNRLIKERQPDILHLHMPNVSAFWALLLPRARRIPWVVHWHADVLASTHNRGLRIFYTLYRPFERAILRHCKAIVASSPPYLASSLPLYNYRGKCHVVPLGLDPAIASSTKPQQSSQGPESPLRVLAIGRLTYYKGFQYLIQAAVECENTEIHLVGTGDQEMKLKALTHELKLEHRVTFHGHLTDEQLADQFTVSDCLCLPSIERTEAFGIVLLEAMRYGKPTIISNVPGSGMGWVVDDGATGLHVPPEDSGALAVSLRYLQQNRAKILLLGENGRQKFDRQFSIEKSAAGVSGLYQVVLDINSANQQQARS